MRAGLLALVAAVCVGGWVIIHRPMELPHVQPTVEQLCADTMRWRSPDHSWRRPGSANQLDAETVPTVSIGDLPSYGAQAVRVAGVLHAEFEWVALYPSRRAIDDTPWRAPWVELGRLWPDGPHWRTKGPVIADRCVVAEGVYLSGSGGPSACSTARLRTSVGSMWSTPLRPIVSSPAAASAHL
jgi:hypothetical protein